MQQHEDIMNYETKNEILFCTNMYGNRPITVAERFKVWVCGRWRTGITSSNPTGIMDICVSLSAVCVQVEVSATGPIPRP
jgi:hypothetical protein